MTWHKSWLVVFLSVGFAAWVGGRHHPTIASEETPEKTLISASNYSRELMTGQDATMERVEHEGESVMQMATGHDADWPGMTLPAPDRHWNLSAYRKIRLHVRNVGDRPVTVHCRVDSPGGDGVKNSLTEHVDLEPRESKELSVLLQAKLPEPLSKKLYGMRGYPGGYAKEKGINTSEVTQLIVFVNKPKHDHVFQVGDIRATGIARESSWIDMSPDEFFPMIDRFGQFMHADWPGKVSSVAELRDDVSAERESLVDYPGPSDWNQYGGWKAGPRLKATGFFYPVERGGKWWLVDPAGRLFWSHGVDCVRFSNATTPITDREFYFARLPKQDSPLSVFYAQASWAPHGYYENKGTYRTFNFTGANLMRKFGDKWQSQSTELTHRRLRSWCMNSIGNWSSAAIYLTKKTPYVVAVGSHGAKPIAGSTGYWGKFPDPFDPSFRESLDRSMQDQREKTAGDPWCIGYFVHNELSWGDELSLATAALASPPEQAAKKVFVSNLKGKYATIGKLNQAWGTDHDSWATLLESRTPPDKNKAEDDLGAFYMEIAEEYFRNCRQAVKQVAPHNLYLGCRFAWANNRAVQAAAKYCDVISYNPYRDDVSDFKLPGGVDMPVLIGEFHFGALDRGMFHTGLRATDSQEDRAAAYRNYVTGAVRNPCLVGSHWFQYGDQATTGRGDGENYQIGLVTVCDRPYPETIAAVRDVGGSMYETRYGRAAAGEGD